MSSNLNAESKLMFYPTDEYEIYRMLGIVGRLSMSIEARNEVRDLLGENKYHDLLNNSLTNSLNNFAISVYDYFLKNKQYDMLHKYITLTIGYSCNQTSTIFDPFAGEAVWLEMFKSTLKRDEINSNKIHLIANELEKNRYNTIVNKGIVDECYNKAYEELSEIPKYSISLLLYNPPYGNTNGKRNVLHYLEMITKQELIYKSNDNSPNGKIILVIRKDDLLESLPLITKHFNVDRRLIYKVNEEEYKKYKQYVVYATLRNEPLDEKNVHDALKHKEEIKTITEIINSNPEFNVKMFNANNMQPPTVSYKSLKENHKIVQDGGFELSITNGDSWKWLKEMTEIKDIEMQKINRPVPLKVGELANLIASGMINGEMDLDGKGTGYHVVAGGTKKQVQQELIQEEGKNGEIINKTKTLVYSQPYLNVLINDNGKVKIKELQGGTELE